MRRETVELNGPYYGREGFWSYGSDHPSWIEARSVAFEANIIQEGDKFKITTRAPVHFHYKHSPFQECRSMSEADTIARKEIRRQSREYAESAELVFVDNTQPFSERGWKRSS